MEAKLRLALVAILGALPACVPSGPQAESRPDAVKVTCEDMTELLTSSVVRQPDGVHFQLSNPAGAGALFVRDPLDAQVSWMRGALAEVDASEFTLPVAPGRWLVSCLHPPVNTLKLTDEDFVPLLVLPESRDAITIFGEATVNRTATTFRVDVEDNAEPGKGSDIFMIQTGSGYSAGGTLTQGNIQVH